MFGLLTGVLAVVATAVAGLAGFALTRDFVRRRLRFVDAIHAPWVPLAVGVAAVVIAAPVAWLLPLVTKGTVAVFGLACAFGAASGARAIARGDTTPRSLPR